MECIMKSVIEGKIFDEERALYGSRSLLVKNCSFDGPADGESALKESSDIRVENTLFNLRYPLWHVDGLSVSDCRMTENCRAALWYSKKITVESTKMEGIKALRECRGCVISGCTVNSPEFGWFCSDITVKDSEVESEYCMMRSRGLSFSGVEFSGKYSFQYVEDAVFDGCTFNTKDAFWHGKNITVKNCIVSGEYLAWYSDGITFENCLIRGTQPLCYCKNLRLVNCRMEGCDLSFEKSEVQAEITTHVDSIKNPAAGTIRVQSAGTIIMDDPQAHGIVVTSGTAE